jgi:hypothetical protein
MPPLLFKSTQSDRLFRVILFEGTSCARRSSTSALASTDADHCVNGRGKKLNWLFQGGPRRGSRRRNNDRAARSVAQNGCKGQMSVVALLVAYAPGAK